MGEKLSRMTQNDTEKVDFLMLQDYGPIMSLSGCYHAFRKGTFSEDAWLVFHLVLVVVINAVHFIELLITAYLAQENLPMTIQAIHLSLLVILSLTILRAFVLRRNSLNLVYIMIAEGFSYDDLGELDLDHFEKQTAKIKRYLKYGVPVYMIISGALLVVITPVMEFMLNTERPEYLNGVNMKLSVPIWTIYPSDDPLMVQVSNGLLALTAAFDSLLFTVGMVAYILINQRIVQHMRTLIFCIDNLETRSVNKYHEIMPHQPRKALTSDYYSDPNFHSCYYRCLSRCIKHHHYILRLLKNYQKIASSPAVFLLMMSSLVIAMSAYGILAVDDSPAFRFTQIMFFAIEIFVVGLMCWYGEETSSLARQVANLVQGYLKNMSKSGPETFVIPLVSPLNPILLPTFLIHNIHLIPNLILNCFISVIKSTLIGDRAFQASWPDCSEKVKRTIRILMTNTMKQLSPIESVIDLKLNLETFSNVLNAAYTYVNLLYATRLKD